MDDAFNQDAVVPTSIWAWPIPGALKCKLTQELEIPGHRPAAFVLGQSMRIVYEDGDGDYEEFQALLMAEIVRSVRQRALAAGVRDKQLRDLVTSIAFDAGAIIDGSQLVSSD